MGHKHESIGNLTVHLPYYESGNSRIVSHIDQDALIVEVL